MSTYFIPGSNLDTIHDSGIFAYVGWALSNGQTLYTEVWENKGPLLYFINLVGVLINRRFGLGVVEFVFMFVSMVFSYKTARLFAGKTVAVLAVVYSFSLLSVTLEGGNLCEEYAILFSVIGLYYTAKFIQSGYEINKGYFIVIGMCGGALAVLRLNLLAYFAAIAVVLSLLLLKEKKIKIFINLCMFSLFGFLIALAPFAVYLLKTGSLGACLDAAYLMGSTFAEKAASQTIHNVIRMFGVTMQSSYSAIFIIVFITVTVPLIVLKKIKNKELFIWTLITDIAFIFNTFANSVSGAYQLHYFMSFIPIFIIPSVIVFDFIYKRTNTRLSHSHVRNCIVGLTVTLIFAPFVCIQGTNIYKNFNTLAHLNIVGVSEYVVEHSSPDDTIQLIGSENGYAAVGYLSQRLSASKYSYYQYYNFTDEKITGFANAIAYDIMRQNPQLILVPHQSVLKEFLKRQSSPKFEKFFKDNYILNYTDSNGFSIYQLNTKAENA